jgi:glutathione S-transferase
MGDEITLYGHPRSGNAYKPALMLALTNTPWIFKAVDLPGRETRGDAYRKLNPFARVPMLEHGDLRICQSNTILLHLAAHTKQFGAGPDVARRLRISEWLFFEQDQVLTCIGRRRFLLHVATGDPAVIAFLGSMGEDALDTLESALESSPWLAGEAPSIADISVYGYARLAEEADYDLSRRPALRAWRERMEALPGWADPATLLPV